MSCTSCRKKLFGALVTLLQNIHSSPLADAAPTRADDIASAIHAHPYLSGAGMGAAAASTKLQTVQEVLEDIFKFVCNEKVLAAGSVMIVGGAIFSLMTYVEIRKALQEFQDDDPADVAAFNTLKAFIDTNSENGKLKKETNFVVLLDQLNLFAHAMETKHASLKRRHQEAARSRDRVAVVGVLSAIVSLVSGFGGLLRAGAWGARSLSVAAGFTSSFAFYTSGKCADLISLLQAREQKMKLWLRDIAESRGTMLSSCCTSLQ